MTGAYESREDKYLHANYQTTSLAVMAAKLYRTPSSVANRLIHLGLSKRKPGRPHKTRCSIFFDDALLVRIKAAAAANGLSMSVLVESIMEEAKI